VVERGGIPLASLLTGANRHDSVVFADVLDAVPPITTPSGQRRKRPAKLHADKAYDIPRCRQALTQRRIKIRIARKGRDSSERLGQHRWVVERTLAWLNRMRRLPCATSAVRTSTRPSSPSAAASSASMPCRISFERCS
jgi:transposase